MKRARIVALGLVVAALAWGAIALGASWWFDAVVLKLKEGKDSEAISSLTTLSHFGHSRAQFLLGEAYAYGRGTARSREEALRWFRRANSHSEGLSDPAAYAAYYVGKAYRDGEGVSKDADEAKFWLELANRGGYRP